MIKINQTSFIKYCILVIFLFTTYASASNSDKIEKMDELMGLYHQYGQFSGSVLVSENGNVIFKKSYGYANREWDIPNQIDTKFRIASITKQFTAMLIMQLVEQGKIDLNAKLTDYLKDYRKDTGDKVTIHQLLTHTSGIPSYTDKQNFFNKTSREYYSVTDFVEKFCSDDLLFTPGEKFAYNNSGYFLLGAIIEKVSGKTYEAMLQEKIFKPLAMNNSGYDNQAQIIKNRASGYQKTIKGFVNAPFLDMSLPYAAGSIYSTVEDLYLWDQALHTEKLISNESKQIMFTPNLEGYAYGWGIGEFKFPDSEETIKSISHSGGINGFATYITRYVDDNNSIILLNNAAGGSVRKMSGDLTNILYGKPYSNPQRSIAETLYTTIEAKGTKQAIIQYRQLKKTHLEQYDFSEQELNRLGYELMLAHQLAQAIEILKLNVEMFPKSANVYDSLAEAYLDHGDKKLAISNYQKSIELDPDNAIAIKILAELKNK